MKSKGFTLIELLAVIVILAIIALIATPIILGIINDAKKQSEDRSAELYLDAAKKAIASYQTSHPDADFSDISECSIETGKIICGTYEIPLEISGQTPTSGTIKLSNGNVTNGTSIVYGTGTDSKTYTYTNGKLVPEGTVETPEPTDSSCFTYTTEKVTGFEINYSTCKSVLPTVLSSMGMSIDNDQLEKACTGVEDGNTKFPMSNLLAVPTYRGIAVQYGIIKSDSILVVENTNEAIITGYTCNDTDVVIPGSIDGKNVTEITINSFTDKNLTSVAIPDSVKKIGSFTFANNSITDLDLGNGVESINSNAFAGNNIESLIIPSSVTVIGRGAFYDNQIESLTLGNSVEVIGASAFSYNQLESVVIPNSVTTINNSAFNRNNLTELIIGNSVSTIGNSAFAFNQLTSVIIPDSVITIGSTAFQGNKLTTLVIGSGIESIKTSAFSGYICRTNSSGGSACSDDASAIPSEYNVDTYGPNALTSVTIDNYEASVTVGNNAFGWADGYNATNNLHWKTN